MCIHIKKSKASAVRRASANPAPAKKNGKASAATSAAVNPAPLKGDMGTTLSPMPEQPKPNNGTNNNCKHIEACAHHNVVDIPASLAAKQSAKTAKRDEEPNAITLTSEQPNSVSPPTNLLDSMIVLSTAISKLKNRKSSKFQCDVEVPAFILIKQYGFGFSTEEVCADESPVPAQRITASRPPLRFDINFRNSAVPLLDESRLLSTSQTLSTEMRKDRLKLLGRRKNNASALEYQPDSNGSSPIESTTNLINLDCNNAARTKSRRRRSAECLVYFRWCEDELTESSA